MERPDIASSFCGTEWWIMVSALGQAYQMKIPFGRMNSLRCHIPDVHGAFPKTSMVCWMEKMTVRSCQTQKDSSSSLDMLSILSESESWCQKIKIKFLFGILTVQYVSMNNTRKFVASTCLFCNADKRFPKWEATGSLSLLIYEENESTAGDHITRMIVS